MMAWDAARRENEYGRRERLVRKASVMTSEQIHDAGIAYARKLYPADEQKGYRIVAAIAWEDGYREAVKLEVDRE
jgi:DUF438 domain-containing protein